MSAYAHIKRCLELSQRDITSALEDRRTAKALLDQLAKVSKPGDGAPKLLLLFAKLAGPDVDWIDGGLRVEMIGDADTTVVEVLTELGLGMHERVFPSFKMSVPLEEFARAVERVPHMVAPLTLSGVTSRRMVLTAIAEEEDEEEVVAPASVAIDTKSLYGDAPRRRSSKDKLAAVKAPGTQLHPRTPSSPKHAAVRKASKPNLGAVKAKSVRPPAAAAEPASVPRQAAAPGSVGRIAAVAPMPATSVPKIVRAPLPRPPALPRTDEHTPTPGPSPLLAARSAIAKVPLARIQVPRNQEKAAPDSRPSKHPKRASVKPPGKGQSKPPERRSKSPPPRGTATAKPRGRSGGSEMPDAEAIDTGWDEKDD
jgi:hypothetical protein